MSATATRSECIRYKGKLSYINTLTKDELDDYSAAGLERVTRKAIKHLRKFDFKDTSLRDLTVCVDTLVKTSRLIRNQSTSNVAISGRVDAIVRVQTLSGRLEQALQGREASSTHASPAPDNANYSNPALKCETIEAQVLESGDAQADAQVLPATPVRRKGYSVHGKRMGRPPKVPPGPTSDDDE